MAILSEYMHYLPILFPILIAIFIWSCAFYRRKQKHPSSIPTYYPVVGMLPAMLQNYHRLHDYFTELLFETGGTFDYKGPWFTNTDTLITCDPENIHYILSKNISNYPKGPKVRKQFDFLGDGIFNSESELWKIHREVILATLHLPDFRKTLQDTMISKLGQGLLPMLEVYAGESMEVDLQDIFQRFIFDVFSILILDEDPGCLSMDLPNVPFHLAFFDAEKALLMRSFVPEDLWKLQKWAGLGYEGKLRKARAVIDHYIYRSMEKKLDQVSPVHHDQFNVLTAFVNAYRVKSLSSDSTTFNSSTITKLFLRDAILSLLLAGRDTISTTLAWFFFLISENPWAEAKILQEIKDVVPGDDDGYLQWNQIICNMNESQKLIYLHAAICETLRLFPPLALQMKAPEEPDILPSGVSVDSDKKLTLSFYSTGRMESVWGIDCLEFKPERWINEHGRIKREPSFNFPAFNAGPRTCLGKEITFVVIKMVVVSLISNYHVELVQGHPVSPTNSLIIHMKHGLNIKLCRRL